MATPDLQQGQQLLRPMPEPSSAIEVPQDCRTLTAGGIRHWGFTAKACRPNRPQTKGKDERGVQYVKSGGIAGHAFERWGQMEGSGVVEP